jgi:hypothetical protein
VNTTVAAEVGTDGACSRSLEVMRASEFRRAVAAEFGEQYGRALLRDLALDGLGNRTGEAALAAGVKEREVWSALCDAMEVPTERRHGVGLPEPRR